MHPILFKIGPISIPSYGACFATGALLAILLTLYLAKREGLNKDKLSDLIFFTLLISLFGAKLFLFITELGYYLKHTGQIKYLLTSGGTFYGGLIFGIIFAFWYIKKHKLDSKLILDCAAPSIALAHFFGRLGCFMAGCCYGRAAHQCSIAVTFPNKEHTVAPAGIPRYPTQLMEAILNLINFIILIFIYKKRSFKGQVFCFYLINYSIIRFSVEFFRGDSDRGYIFGGMNHPFSSLSVPQLISLLGFVSGVLLYRYFKKASLKA
jgi:phosphatidylglycerol:prolipoprotein diacylglycerol transferase